MNIFDGGSFIDNRINNSIYKPEFFRVSRPEDRQRLEALKAGSQCIFLCDEIEDQLKELIKKRNPTIKISKEAYPEYIKKHLNGTNISEYGVWVYYPWSQRLVHLLDEEEYTELRTSANRNKITTEEQKILATKKVGVIGLSVGQSVSVTMAMERCFGELRLADFDTLELNNLNRIRTGVHNLGVLKVVSVAREIAEMDPFLNVTCYPEGITDENIHDFYTKGGKLDAVIDECDGVNIKILCRIKAKELSIPVLMEASDRGTLDVERFDLEPERPIMHGWLEHLDIDMQKLKNLKTSEEKLPYILPISGMDTLSPRMKASMAEIEQTLTTWPQLATAVTLGGALTADTCRRMFLNQFTASGRYFIDLEELIPDTRKPQTYQPDNTDKSLTTDEMSAMARDAIQGLQPSPLMPEKKDLMELLAAAAQAPSAGNNQPWKWHYQDGNLFLFHDISRSRSFGDFEHMASYVAFGTAIENLELEAYKHKIGTSIKLFPLANNKQLIAVVQFTNTPNTSLYEPEILEKYIGERHTNRGLGSRKPLDTKAIQELKDAVASIPGAELLIKDSEKDLDELAAIMGGAERLRILHPAGHYEFYEKEVRWTDEQSRQTGDGIDITTMEVTPSELVGFKLLKDPRVVKLLLDWKAGNALEKPGRKAIQAASAVGLITMPAFTSENYVLGGRAVQRMWLKATACNISMQPMLAATLHFARLNHGNGAGLSDYMQEEFAALYKRFEQLFPGIKEKGEIFLFRLSVTDKPKVKSYRIPIQNVISGLN